MDARPPFHRQIPCIDATTLQHAYQRVADAEWVDGCVVDFPNLVLEVRVAAPWHVGRGLEAQLAVVERIARGLGRIHSPT